RKGITLREARGRVLDPMYHALLMLRAGHADAVVAGVEMYYSDAIRPALEVIGAQEGRRHVSGIYMLVLAQQTLFFADCTVNIDPDADRLAGIASTTAGVLRRHGPAGPRAAARLRGERHREHGRDCRCGRPGARAPADCMTAHATRPAQESPRRTIGLDALGLAPEHAVHWNLVPAALYEHAARRGEGVIADGGAFCAVTSPHTGRSPSDKFIVRDSASEGDVWWGRVNQPMSAEHFERLH